jgi:hypothetical protein
MIFYLLVYLVNEIGKDEGEKKSREQQKKIH